jgi:hypothetical protein
MGKSKRVPEHQSHRVEKKVKLVLRKMLERKLINSYCSIADLLVLRSSSATESRIAMGNNLRRPNKHAETRLEQTEFKTAHTNK